MRSQFCCTLTLFYGMLAFAADPVPSVFKPGERILFQGDSITALGRGLMEDPNHSLGHSYVFLIAAKYGSLLRDRKLVFINMGIGGDKLADMAHRWQKDTLDLKSDLLSILIGINDAGHDVPIEEFEPGYDRLLPGILGRRSARNARCWMPNCRMDRESRRRSRPAVLAARSLRSASSGGTCSPLRNWCGLGRSRPPLRI
jgi:hypothetical protein